MSDLMTPTELQHMILFYVRQDYYYNRYTKTIGRIVQNKLTVGLNNIINERNSRQQIIGQSAISQRRS